MKIKSVSLTDFVDFVGKKDGPRRTCVRRWAAREEWDPRTDYWNKLRKAIVRYHKKHGVAGDLVATAEGATKTKLRNYRELVAAYLRWASKVDTDWSEPAKGPWLHRGLTINVNPELGLTFGGKTRLVKLYFKKAPLTDNAARLILQLMAEVCHPGMPPGTVLMVLDIRRGKFYEASAADPSLAAVVRKEAAEWKRLIPPTEAA